MDTNRIHAHLTAADQQEVLAAIATIHAKLPFLLQITEEERRSMPKLGERGRAFLKKAAEMALADPEFLPREFDLDELQTDAALVERLHPILDSLTRLGQMVEDTYLLAGSEAYVASLLVYHYAKLQGRSTEGIDSSLDEMGRRFARKTSGDERM